MTNAPFGMYGGILVISIPQMLNSRHVPEAIIAAFTAVTVSPGMWSIVASPMLDVRFSRRWYSVVTVSIAALLLSIALVNLDETGLAEFLLVTGFFAANLYQSALGGWLSSVIAPEERSHLSAWLTIANISGGGAMAVIAGEVASRFPPTETALILGGVLLLPIVVFPWIPAPGPDRRLASDSFGQFFREVGGILKRREVLLSLVMFALPGASFALVNLLAGLGSEYHASMRFVGAIGGAGVVAAGIAGCLIFRLVDRLMPLRFLYLTIGVVGAGFTLALTMLPLTPLAFAIALIGENLFQSAAITAAIAVSFDTIGERNPLAATTFCLMVSVMNLPNTYMIIVDGWGHAWHGIAGSFVFDACASLVACTLLGMLLLKLRSPRKNLAAAAAGLSAAPD
ncbi:MAG: MFS transporter [Steroidobacteraceae bacterium]